MKIGMNTLHQLLRRQYIACLAHILFILFVYFFIKYIHKDLALGSDVHRLTRSDWVHVKQAVEHFRSALILVAGASSQLYDCPCARKQWALCLLVRISISCFLFETSVVACIKHLFRHSADPDMFCAHSLYEAYIQSVRNYLIQLM